jgi:Protein of unknown function (DUF3035)
MSINLALRVASVVGLIALSACSGDDLSRSVGLTRDTPDEFTVTTRAPLSMPPDYELRPPRPGASRPQELSERQQAEAALAPDALLNAAPTDVSPGQQALLRATGPEAPKDIRNKVDAETQLDRPGQSFTDHLMFWKDVPPVGTPIDATRESQRLRQNAALGQSPESGETPIIQRPKPGWLDSIF